MLTLFKYIDYAFKAKQGYKAPHELLADTSFGFLEIYFIIGFFTSIILGGGLLTLGIVYNLIFLKIIGIIFLVVFVINIIFYCIVKGFVKKISRQSIQTVQQKMRNRKSIYVDSVQVK